MSSVPLDPSYVASSQLIEPIPSIVSPLGEEMPTPDQQFLPLSDMEQLQNTHINLDIATASTGLTDVDISLATDISPNTFPVSQNVNHNEQIIQFDNLFPISSYSQPEILDATSEEISLSQQGKSGENFEDAVNTEQIIDVTKQASSSVLWNSLLPETTEEARTTQAIEHEHNLQLDPSITWENRLNLVVNDLATENSTSKAFPVHTPRVEDQSVNDIDQHNMISRLVSVEIVNGSDADTMIPEEETNMELHKSEQNLNKSNLSKPIEDCENKTVSVQNNSNVPLIAEQNQHELKMEHVQSNQLKNMNSGDDQKVMVNKNHESSISPDTCISTASRTEIERGELEILVQKAYAEGYAKGKCNHNMNEIGSNSNLISSGKKETRRFTLSADPAHYCHICGRTGKIELAVCGNNRDKMCRKVICIKCLIKHEPDMVEHARKKDSDWTCPHCRHSCPAQARCSHYTKNNKKRRKKKDMEKGNCEKPKPKREEKGQLHPIGKEFVSKVKRQKLNGPIKLHSTVADENCINQFCYQLVNLNGVNIAPQTLELSDWPNWDDLQCNTAPGKVVEQQLRDLFAACENVTPTTNGTKTDTFE